MSTVRLLTKRRVAISRFVRPSATRRSTSSSRRESPPARTLDGLAEDLQLLGGAAGERAGAELPRRPVGVVEQIDRGLTLAGGRERHRGPDLGLRSLVWGRGIARSSSAWANCRAAPSASPWSKASSPRACASAATASVLPVAAATFASASAHAPASTSRPAGEKRRRPAERRDRVMPFVPRLPAFEKRAHSLGCLVVSRLDVLDAGERLRGLDLQPEGLALPCKRQRLREQARDRAAARRGARGRSPALRSRPCGRTAVQPGPSSTSRQTSAARATPRVHHDGCKAGEADVSRPFESLGPAVARRRVYASIAARYAAECSSADPSRK